MKKSIDKEKSQKSQKIQNGKGSRRRPVFVSQKELEKNWKRIFKQK